MSEKIKLGELGEVVSGSTPKTNIKDYWDGEILWITPAEIQEDDYYIADTQRKITNLAVDKTNLKLLPKGTVLLSSRAPIGKVAICDNDMYCNQGFKNIICSDRLENRYVYYFLKYNVEYIKSLGRGATFKEISKGIVENLEIPYIEKKEQIEIANKLDKITEILKIKKQQIKQFDEIIKSQFVEMFQSGNYPKEELGKLCDVRDGTHDSPKYLEESGYKFITSKNIINNEIDFSEVKYISKQDYDKFNTRSKVNYGDILMPMIGTIGKPMIVNIPDDEIDFAIKNVALIKFLGNSQVTNIYIKNLLDSDYFENAILQNKRGGTQKFIALSDIRKMQIEIPPIELQNQFADIVKQIDKQKFEIESSLREMQELYEALMERYFG